MKADHPAIRMLERGFGALLLFYPKTFRNKFGREMKLTFLAEARAVHQASGAFALLPFCVRIIVDSVISSGREYLDMPQRLLATVIVLALVFIDWLAFHDISEPHTVRDYLTLIASILVFTYIALDLRRRRIAVG